jgi:hypothetical protein
VRHGDDNHVRRRKPLNYHGIPNLILMTILTACLLSAQDSTTFIYEAKQYYSQVSDNLLKSAEEMPAKYYSFQPTSESPAFNDLIGEAVASQADVCSAIEGKRIQMEGPSADEKTELMTMLTKSVRACASVYSSINDFNASQKVRFGGVERSKLGLLFLNAGHDNELYGQIAVYLRLKGLVPPSNRARLLPVVVP